MTNETVVSFETTTTADLPSVGQRKRVRLNGKVETLYVREVNVRCSNSYADPKLFRGTYTLVPHYVRCSR